MARARFIEDLVAERARHGTGQYVLLGAGLDTFAQRRPDLASRLTVFEVDQPGTQAWKRRRLVDLGYGVPEWLRLVPVDFEEGASWQDEVAQAGFDAARPAVVASTGVSMYLTREANAATLRDLATLAPGSTVAMTFLLPLDLVDERDRQGWIMSENGARSSGTPFISFFPRMSSSAWPARPGSPTCGTCPGATSTTGTSRAVPTACACRPARTSWSPPRSGSRPSRPAGARRH